MHFLILNEKFLLHGQTFLLGESEFTQNKVKFIKMALFAVFLLPVKSDVLQKSLQKCEFFHPGLNVENECPKYRLGS